MESNIVPTPGALYGTPQATACLYYARLPRPIWRTGVRLSAACEARLYGTEHIFARLKRVAGKHTTTLTHYGRKTGKPHEVTIWFILDDDKLYLGTANVKRQWVRNVQKTLKIRLSVAGEKFEGNARFLADRAEHERAMAAIRRKYWMFRPLIALGRVLAAMGLMRDNTGSFEVTLAA